MRLYILACLVSVSGAVCGQGMLKFEKETHDFEKIKEADGSVEYSFVFINSGDQNVQISDVKSSCGCTVPFWSQAWWISFYCLSRQYL